MPRARWIVLKRPYKSALLAKYISEQYDAEAFLSLAGGSSHIPRNLLPQPSTSLLTCEHVLDLAQDLNKFDELIDYIAQEDRPDLAVELYALKEASRKTPAEMRWEFFAINRVWLIPLAALIIAGVVAAIVFPLPMNDAGFNVVVARFVEIDDLGRTRNTKLGREMTDWIILGLEPELDGLPSFLGANIRTPPLVGAVHGSTPEARDARAAQLAERHNADIVIYGIISETEKGHALEMAFYVRQSSFEFGREIIGSEQLGTPVEFTSLSDPGPDGRERVLDAIEDRREVLEHVVKGLSYFQAGRYENATSEFQNAVDVTGWQDEEGKEVAYLLLGAASLRQYDVITNPRELERAEISFELAKSIDEDYARVYLGLGAVQMQLSLISNENGTGVQVQDESKLFEAQNQYMMAQQLIDDTDKSFIDAKASYGLGQVHLAGYICRVRSEVCQAEEWSLEEAQRYFDATIDAYYDNSQPAELLWLAGNSLIYQGQIAAYNDDWQPLVDDTKDGIELLTSVPEVPISWNIWIARAYDWQGYGYAKLGDVDRACRAYQQALDFGEQSASPAEIEQWEQQQNDLNCNP